MRLQEKEIIICSWMASQCFLKRYNTVDAETINKVTTGTYFVVKKHVTDYKINNAISSYNKSKI